MLSLLPVVAVAALHAPPVVDANPDAPVSGLAWRAGNVRASLGIVIPFV